MNPDKLTSVLGLIGAVLIASSANLPGALAGEPAEIGKLAGAVTAALFGFLTNRGNHPTKKYEKGAPRK